MKFARTETLHLRGQVTLTDNRARPWLTGNVQLCRPGPAEAEPAIKGAPLGGFGAAVNLGGTQPAERPAAPMGEPGKRPFA